MRYTELGSSCTSTLYSSRRTASSSSSLGGSNHSPEGAWRNGPEMLLLVDVHNLVWADGFALFPYLYEELVVVGHASKFLNPLASQLMLGSGVGLIVDQDLELWHQACPSASGILVES